MFWWSSSATNIMADMRRRRAGIHTAVAARDRRHHWRQDKLEVQVCGGGALGIVGAIYVSHGGDCRSAATALRNRYQYRSVLKPEVPICGGGAPRIMAEMVVVYYDAASAVRRCCLKCGASA